MIDKSEYQLYATCPDEVTGLLAKEIASIGGTRVRTDYRVVYFSGSKEVSYQVHLHSRLASRIYRILKEIPAHSPTIIFDKAKKIRFHELFSEKLGGQHQRGRGQRRRSDSHTLDRQ